MSVAFAASSVRVQLCNLTCSVSPPRNSQTILLGGMRSNRPLKPPNARRSGRSRRGFQSAPQLSVVRGALAIAALSMATLVGYLVTRLSAHGTSKGESDGLRGRMGSEGGVAPRAHGEQRMAPVYAAEVVDVYDHDLDAFTQGLALYEGKLYESTGLVGRSSVRQVDLETGDVVKRRDLKDKEFGEGLAVAGAGGQELVQVLWKVGKGYVYNREDLKLSYEFDFEGDAWGLASQPDRDLDIYLSDGSSRIRVFRLIDGDFLKIREFTVTDGTKEVGLLNELELVGDELWANVWMSECIARIDRRTGVVRSWVDLRKLLGSSALPSGHTADVLNGIASDGEGRVFVTGKLWPKLFSIRVTNRKAAESIADVGNAFFLEPERVRYVHKHVLI